MTAPALALDAVSHAYGAHPALREVSFDVETGALHALLGPNGSGKTTLFRILTTLLRPDAGTARIAGESVTERPDAVRRRFGVAFQHVALDEQLTVAENLGVQAALYGLSRSAANERAAHLLAALGLDALAQRRIRTLSGGEKRRADLARALMHRPSMLLLDEPTTALDPTARRQFHDLLAHLRATEGVTILMATHLLDEAEDADAVTILHRGHVVADGSPDVLRAQLGDETLWITPMPGGALGNGHLPDLGSATVTRVGSRLRIAHDRPAEVLADVSARFPGAIAAATLRRPTLEDVFASATGEAYADVPPTS